MSERDFTYQYRPLPLVQRAGVSSLGSAASFGDEQVRRASSSSRAWMDATAAASGNDASEDRSPDAERTYRQRRSSLRVVGSARDEARDSDAASTRDRRRTRAERRPVRRSRVTSAYDDFDDYYAAYDDEPEGDGYAAPAVDRAGSGRDAAGRRARRAYDDPDAAAGHDAASRWRVGGPAVGRTGDVSHDDLAPGTGYAALGRTRAATLSSGRLARRNSGDGPDAAYAPTGRSARRAYDDPDATPATGRRALVRIDDDPDDPADAPTRRPARSGWSPAPVPRPQLSSYSLLELLAMPLMGLGKLARYHIRLWAFVLAIVLAVAMLFAPVRNLYLAHRQLGDLQATYDALEAENQAIRDEIDLLMTQEGIENKARERGYVSEGETKVVVEGLPLEEEQDEVAISPTRDERPWYVRLLDTVFGYDYEGDE